MVNRRLKCPKLAGGWGGAGGLPTMRRTVMTIQAGVRTEK